MHRVMCRDEGSRHQWSLNNQLQHLSPLRNSQDKWNVKSAFNFKSISRGRSDMARRKHFLSQFEVCTICWLRYRGDYCYRKFHCVNVYWLVENGLHRLRLFCSCCWRWNFRWDFILFGRFLRRINESPFPRIQVTSKHNRCQAWRPV